MLQTNEFSDVDRSSDPGALVRYLDMISAWAPRQEGIRTAIERLEPKPGHHILDVGCGTGDALELIARIIGSSGRAVGIDSSETMVTEAQKRIKGLGLPIEVRVGDASHLDFPDGSFDRCITSRVLQHLEDPRQALHEMARVARSGARIVALEPDWGTLLFDASDLPLTEKILGVVRASIRSSNIGRRLHGLFRDVGLTEVLVTARAITVTDFEVARKTYLFSSAIDDATKAGVLSASDVAGWFRDLDERNRAGRFFATMAVFGAVGQKP